MRLRVFCIATSCYYVHIDVGCCCIFVGFVFFALLLLEYVSQFLSLEPTSINIISLSFKNTTIIEGFLPFARPMNTKSMQSILIILDFG